MTTDPKLGTFLYLWYTKGPNWGNWSECQPADAGNVTDCNAIGKGNEIIPCPNPNDHVPPGRWAGRYLPKLDGIGQPGDLYSSQDTNVMI